MRVVLFCLIVFALISCTREPAMDTSVRLIFRVRFDSTMDRLNNLGIPASVPAGHGAQHPVINAMAVDYIELLPGRNTPLSAGAVIYKTDITYLGGDSATDFSRLVPAGHNEVFFATRLNNIAPGEYEWLRVGFAYLNTTIAFRVDSTVNDSTEVHNDFIGNLTYFLGAKTYIGTYSVKSQQLVLDTNKVQGYWGFEGLISGDKISEVIVREGQSDEGATTVVNLLHDTSPLPPGSGIVTAAFAPGKLVITGAETENIVVELAISVNKSFEWKEQIENGKWDVLKEPIVDMGLRGMNPTIR